MNEMPRCTETHYGDSTDRPDIYGIAIRGKRGKLLSLLYTAGGAGPHPTVLLLHGIPGSEQNLDLAQALRRAGFHVMTFHYSGSWGSDGEYSLANDLEDANTVLDYILGDNTYGFDKTRIYAVGHSLGGFVCGHLTAKRPEIRGGVLLAPCDIGRLPLIAEEDTQSYQVIKELLYDCPQWLAGVTTESLLREVEEHSEAFRLENLAAQLAGKPILCISGSLDSCTPESCHCAPLERGIAAAGGTQLRRIRYPSDHFFSDYRLTLAETVTEYMTQLLSL